MGSVLLIIIVFLVLYFVLVMIARHMWELFTDRVIELVTRSFHWATRGRFK